MASKTSPAQKLRYAAYSSGQNWKKNRIARLERHLKKHPEDKPVIAALANVKAATQPRRAGTIKARKTD